MTYTVPYEQIDARVAEEIRIAYEETKKMFPTQEQPTLMWRDIRPEELNAALTPATRIWDSTCAVVPNTWTRILGAAASPTVPGGNKYVFFGYHVVDDPTGAASIGIGASVRFSVNGTVKSECSAYLANVLNNHRIYKFNERYVIDQNQFFDVEFKSAIASARAIVLPIMIRIGQTSVLANN